MQLSYGLSTEYSNKPAQDKPEVINADQQIYAKYYVSQILQLGEEGIRDAWYKARRPLLAVWLAALVSVGGSFCSKDPPGVQQDPKSPSSDQARTLCCRPLQLARPGSVIGGWSTSAGEYGT